MKNSIDHFSLKSIIFFTYLIFTVLPSKATILKFNCVGSFGYDVSYKTNIKNRIIKKSRPIFTENKNPKSFIVSYDLETGNGYIDGNEYIDGKEYSEVIVGGKSLLFKSKSYERQTSRDGSIRKSTSKLEVFSFIIDDYKNVKKYIVSNIKGTSNFTAQKRRRLINTKKTLKGTASLNIEKETKNSYEFISGWCKE